MSAYTELLHEHEELYHRSEKLEQIVILLQQENNRLGQQLTRQARKRRLRDTLAEEGPEYTTQAWINDEA